MKAGKHISHALRSIESAAYAASPNTGLDLDAETQRRLQVTVDAVIEFRTFLEAS